MSEFEKALEHAVEQRDREYRKAYIEGYNKCLSDMKCNSIEGKCDNCNRWKDDCDGKEEYEVDCGWM